MEKLTKIQNELNAPKSRWNKFGRYWYRSCEDILEALKPLLDKYKASVTVTDDVVLIGTRVYVKATATFVDYETGQTKEATAFARESEAKKGMDESMLTATASSYARKYCLSGLFLIDDVKDPDTDENHIECDERQEEERRQNNRQQKQQKAQPKEKEFNPGEVSEKIAKLNAIKSLCQQGKLSEQAIINAFRSKKPNLQSIDELAENQLLWILKEENWVYLR